ncbi:unnamed protein product [Cuscuta campestris]|uniref:Uncharacterized protein n=1 Tax=Cuscuta campestris TaxID=132261 RepID=A0A484ND69_9ASTE|nr:unnamed protein product [Cuscuta campestris]
MDLQFSGLPDSVSTLKQQDEPFFPSFKQSQDTPYNYLDDSLALYFTGDPLTSPTSNNDHFAPPAELDSPDDHDTDPVFKYLNQILLEEDIDAKPSMFHDPIALKAAENYFYEALDKNHPSPHQSLASHNTEGLGSICENSSEPYSSNGSTSSNHSDSSQWMVDPGQSKSHLVSCPPEPYSHSFQTTSGRLNGSLNSSGSNMHVQVDSLWNPSELGNIFSNTEAIMHFKRGMEEANKFLPSNAQLALDLDKYSFPPKTGEMPNDTITKVEKNKINSSLNSSTSRKKHHHPDNNEFEEERSSKQSAVYVEEELSEMFDKVLLCDLDECRMNILSSSEIRNSLPHNVPNGGDIQLLSEAVKSKPHDVPNGGKHSAERPQGDTSEVVDLRTLLISCAQSIGANDRRTANEQLKLIQEHCSPNGDANQRLAYVLANGLEARLSGTGTQLYTSLPRKRITAFEKLKAYQVYMSACPFKKISIGYANKMVYMVSQEAKTLHLIDFGIQYGFQWPALIQHLSMRPGGPPKLRVTGIDLPQPGFRPAELIEETGRRLAKYCERFGVQFEYNAIATQNWEAIKIEDFKLARRSDEMVAVNCSFRLKDLLDETVMVDSPRDAVLRLILKLNPGVFVHTIQNGSFSSPFFATRFREAVFHYHAHFDIFESTLSRDDPQRFLFEQEFYGREMLNVIACEGAERIVRPETYKRWHLRSMRAGFKPLPLNSECMNKLRKKLKAYHKDFLFDKEDVWMLQGWKGRILCASSCWVPA